MKCFYNIFVCVEWISVGSSERNKVGNGKMFFSCAAIVASLMFINTIFVGLKFIDWTKRICCHRTRRTHTHTPYQYQKIYISPLPSLLPLPRRRVFFSRLLWRAQCIGNVSGFVACTRTISNSAAANATRSRASSTSCLMRSKLIDKMDIIFMVVGFSIVYYFFYIVLRRSCAPPFTP